MMLTDTQKDLIKIICSNYQLNNKLGPLECNRDNILKLVCQSVLAIHRYDQPEETLNTLFLKYKDDVLSYIFELLHEYLTESEYLIQNDLKKSYAIELFQNMISYDEK